MTLAAELYALTHPGHRGDLAFYRRACRGARSVLELGCGSGRLLGALAAPERTLVGLDVDQGLLRLARSNVGGSTRLVRADMRRFELGQRFERVLIPYSGFYCLLRKADALACLRAARRHLEADGLLLFDAWAADGFHASGTPQGADIDERSEVSVRGRRFRVFEHSVWRRRLQRLDVSYLYADRRSGRRIELPLPQRYWLSRQIGPLLDAAGLKLVTLGGDFTGARYSPPSSDLIVVTARPR